MPTWFISAIVALIVGLSGGAAISNHLWQAKWDKHVAADKVAVAKAAEDARKTEKASARVVVPIASHAAAEDQKIVTRTITLIKEVPRYVTPAQDARSCITYGLVRVLDAAALGTRPAELPLPAGQSDDACAPVASSALASSVAANYGVALQNSTQLDALIDSVSKSTIAFNGDTP